MLKYKCFIKFIQYIKLPYFKPYAGVSTAIMIFTKTGTGGTDKVWFYDMKADGYSLDDKRNPIEDNDINDIVERFSNLDKEVDRKRKKNRTKLLCTSRRN